MAAFTHTNINDDRSKANIGYLQVDTPESHCPSLAAIYINTLYGSSSTAMNVLLRTNIFVTVLNFLYVKIEIKDINPSQNKITDSVIMMIEM